MERWKVERILLLLITLLLVVCCMKSCNWDKVGEVYKRLTIVRAPSPLSIMLNP